MKTQPKKLILIASSPRPFAGTDFTKDKALIDKAFESGHSVSTIYYFHGEVEDFAGYDIGACLNAEEFLDTEKGSLKEGIYDAELIGYDKLLKAFLWNDEFKRSRGLIVAADNKRDMAFARRKYNSRTSVL